jgi:ethanolamine permease
MAAEEARDPHRAIPIAYLTGVVTLTLLAFGVMVFAGGSGIGQNWPISTIHCRKR